MIAHVLPLRWYEAAIVRMPPYPTLLVFVAPGALLFPVKISALWLVGHGHPVVGFGAIAVAKVLGTAVVTRSFILCKPKLLTIPWFARLHDYYYVLRGRLYAAVKEIAAIQRLWQTLHRARAQLATAIKGILSRVPRDGQLLRRWTAARRRLQYLRQVARFKSDSGTPPTTSVT